MFVLHVDVSVSLFKTVPPAVTFLVFSTSFLPCPLSITNKDIWYFKCGWRYKLCELIDIRYHINRYMYLTHIL